MTNVKLYTHLYVFNFELELYLTEITMVIKYLRQVGGFLWVSSTNKPDCHDIAEILLKVALNTITPTTYKDLSLKLNK
jgi:hypothetical protein